MLITTTGECIVQPLRRFSLAELRGMFLTVNLYNGPPAVVERMRRWGWVASYLFDGKARAPSVTDVI